MDSASRLIKRSEDLISKVAEADTKPCREDVEHELHAALHVVPTKARESFNNKNRSRGNLPFLSVFKELPKRSKFDVLLPADHFLDHADLIVRVFAFPPG